MITELTSKAIAVTIPEDANIETAFIASERYSPTLVYKTKTSLTSVHISLPLGNWQILDRADWLEEDQWKGIVAYIPYGNLQRWRDYSGNESFCLSATESGLSLLKSKGLNPDTTLILIKQS